ncbi:hypothetical protein [Rhodobacter sp. CZR27]|uniref:hypothetical protein n=1 Tax=Rhodobacter sp. CZR27 TaxID=2033869 RepID=UPI000BBE0893|nr:hypothetical protein [Rhodobacter sp. CZR27]
MRGIAAHQIKAGTAAKELRQPLLGHEVIPVALTSGLYAILFGDRLRGGADPRREGIAVGE